MPTDDLEPQCRHLLFTDRGKQRRGRQLQGNLALVEQRGGRDLDPAEFKKFEQDRIRWAVGFLDLFRACINLRELFGGVVGSGLRRRPLRVFFTSSLLASGIAAVPTRSASANCKSRATPAERKAV